MVKSAKKTCCLCLFFCLLFVCSYGQQLFNGNDLSKLNVDAISDNDLIHYQQELKARGLSIADAEKIAVSKGLTPAQLAKLRQRLQALQTVPSVPPRSNDAASPERAQPTSDNSVTGQPVDNRIFGAALFSSSSLSFQPDLKIATPVNYQLGPDDQLLIAVYGIQEASFNLTISPEGSIYIPNVGEIMISGLTVEEARDRIRGRMSQIFTSLKSGTSKLSINLGKIRSIRVTVLGSNKPGTYTVSSLTTLFNLLYLSGGPSLNGSFREIELIRNNKVERKVDLYNFLLSGSEADNVRIQENDIVRIPVYRNRVEIEGEIKRPGIFEILPGETVNDLIYFASGFTDSAYRASIKIVELTSTQRKVKDLEASEFSTYHPGTGDFYVVSKILSRFENRVVLEGALPRPGYYELTPGLTLSKLIQRAAGLREDAYLQRGELIRQKEDLTNEIIPFNVADILNGRNDIPLQREDHIIISSLFDIKGDYVISIQGEVRKPGGFKFIEGLTLKDLILQAGGFTDAAYPQRIEIARLIRRDTLTKEDTRLSQIINIRDINDLTFAANNVALLPFDVVIVRRLPGYLDLESVGAIGQVQYPGPYVLQNRIERVSDLLRRAGGLTPEAFADAAYLRRLNTHDVISDVKAGIVNKMQQELKDNTGQVTASSQRVYDQIPLNLRKILSVPGGEEDIILKAGDELFIPRNDQEIKISGEVLSPTQATFNRTKSLKNYIGEAGGFTDNARRKKTYVIYPNGRAAATHHFLFVVSYPSIKPGTEIIVPKYIPRERTKRNPTEVVALASAVASLAYIVVALLKL